MAQNKTGRPPSNSPMNDRIFVRVDEDTKMKLKKCVTKLNTTISDVVRQGINKIYDDLKQ
jgi:antitoxin component of RelBE/YafQ-DinJ toxin-antitoxin module